MKDVTFGVKVPEELRDQINEMMKDSGLVGREFMQELIDSYMLDKSKNEIPEMAQEIKELQSLTHRINEMYLYLGTRFQDIISLKEKEKETINEEIIKEKEDYQDEVEKYSIKIRDLEEEMQGVQKELKESNDTIKAISTKMDETRESNENYKELNTQYKDKINQLTKKVEDLRSYKEKNDSLVVESAKLQEANDSLASDLWFSKREIEKLSDTLVKAKQEHISYIARLKDQQNLEKQTALLEVQLKSQKTIEDLNNKIINLQKEYNDKVKQLLFNVENSKGESE